MARIQSYKAKQQKKCWCGSNKHFKNCHGSAGTQPPAPAQEKGNRAPNLTGNVFGVPGEEHKIIVAPIFKGKEREIPNLQGAPGLYTVQLLLSRPGIPLWAEREHRFIDQELGNSHIQIAKPVAERTAKDADHMLFEANTPIGKLVFRGLPNEQGFLGKFIADQVFANNFGEAEVRAYNAIAPFLSAWSLNLDIPLNVHTIQVTETSTHISSVRARTPHYEMTTSAGLSPLLTDEFCHYASMYREGQNTNSAFYRFLCFFKIIESIKSRRQRLNADRAKQGLEIVSYKETIPEADHELMEILRRAYSWRADWNGVSLSELFPLESRGKRISQITDRLNRIRIGIAHALLRSGEITISIDALPDIMEVNEWLPLCRILARWLLSNEFPEQFEFKPKELPQAFIDQYQGRPR